MLYETLAETSLNFFIYSVAKNLRKIRVITSSFYGESCEKENEYSIQFGQELKTSLIFFFFTSDDDWTLWWQVKTGNYVCS